MSAGSLNMHQKHGAVRHLSFSSDFWILETQSTSLIDSPPSALCNLSPASASLTSRRAQRTKTPKQYRSCSTIRQSVKRIPNRSANEAQCVKSSVVAMTHEGERSGENDSGCFR